MNKVIYLILFIITISCSHNVLSPDKYEVVYFLDGDMDSVIIKYSTEYSYESKTVDLPFEYKYMSYKPRIRYINAISISHENKNMIGKIYRGGKLTKITNTSNGSLFIQSIF